MAETHSTGVPHHVATAVSRSASDCARAVVASFTSSGTNATRAVQKIFAEGAVVINTPDNKTANSDQAEYTADEGKVVLTGKPRVETPDGVVTGEKITFWRGSQKMDVVAGASETNRTRLIIYPEEQRKKE